MNNLDKQYIALVKDILENGVKKEDRTGTGTISVFGRQIRHKMGDGFPLLTTKKLYFKGIVTELLWFLRGETNIQPLVKEGNYIWVGDAYKNYLKKYKPGKTPGIVYYSDPLQYKPFTQEEFINKIKTDDEFAKKWGELGPIYGAQWRSWNKYIVKPGLVSLGDGRYNENYWDIDKPIDQIANLIHDLRTNPDSRRLMVSAWNVGELDQMILPPCHHGFQVYTRELSVKERIELAFKSIEKTDGNSAALLWKLSCQGKEESEIIEALDNSPRNIPTKAISLMWNQRSVDVGLGAPFNIASYGLLLEIIAKEVNMIPDELIGNLGDVHLYLDHVEPIKEQLNRKPFELPILKIHSNVDDISHYKVSDFELIGYQSHPTIKLPLSN